MNNLDIISIDFITLFGKICKDAVSFHHKEAMYTLSTMNTRTMTVEWCKCRFNKIPKEIKRSKQWRLITEKYYVGMLSDRVF